MNKNKHLSLSERAMIEQHLNNRMSFRGIGRELSKDPTTIAKEVKNHIYFKSSGAYGRPFNDCLGGLGRKMDEMREQLRILIEEIRHSETTLNAVVIDIKENVLKQDESIENVSATTEELAASMEETSATAESINSMSEQIGAATKNIADRAQDGAQQAAQIHERANSAKIQTITQREKSNTVQMEIRASLEQALLDVKVVEKIGVLSSSIMDITNQTNLLALNASIEAVVVY